MRRLILALISLGCAALAIIAYFSIPAAPIELSFFSEPISLREPRALAALALLPLFAAFALSSLTDLAPLPRTLATLARALSFTLLALALSAPHRMKEELRLAEAILIDVSDSISDEDLSRLEERLAGLSFDSEPLFIRFAAEPSLIQKSDAERLQLERPEATSETDLGAALLHAASLMPADHHRRILILSDGRETRGDAESIAAQLAAQGVEIHALRIDVEVPAEVALLELEAPPKIEASRPFILRVKLEATRSTRIRLELRQGELPNALDPVKELELEPGVHTIEFRSIAHHAGPLDYMARLTVEGEDRFEGNNKLSIRLNVEGKPSALIVASPRSRTSHLADALISAGFEVSRAAPNALPTSREALAFHRGIFLVDLHSSELNDARQRALLDAARVDGVTLIYSGGEKSYGLGELQGTRLAEALPVSLEGEKKLERPALALSLVIDKSGSMAGVKLELAKQAARATLDLLNAEDLIQIVGFDSRPSRDVRMQAARNRMSIRRAISAISASGGTAIAPALEMAYADLSLTRAELKHMILFTDGQARETGIPELVRRMRAEGITVSTIGLGSDVERSLLESIARLGGGRSHFTADPQHIPRLFVNETRAAMRSSAIEAPVSIRQLSRTAALRGIPFAEAPLLRGYIATRMKPRPAELLLETSSGEPLLARRKLGLGSLYAWTSDLEPRWAAGFLRWRHFSAFLAQLLRDEESSEELERLKIELSRRGPKLAFFSDAIDSRGELLSGLDGRFTLHDHMGASIAEGEARERAPGVYAAEVELPGHAAYQLSLELHQEGTALARGVAPLVYPYPDEWAALGLDEAALDRLSRLGGGALHESFESFLSAPFPPSPRMERATFWMLVAALFAFLLDLLIRRTRLFG